MPLTAPESPVAAPIEGDLFCPQCDYNLRGLSELRCPECGAAFDPAKLTATALPWLHRRRLGRFRAYAQTFDLVVRHPRRFAAEMSHAHPYRDAQSFRWMTVGLALLPVVFATMANWDSQNQLLWQPPDGGGMGIGFAAIYLLGAAVAYTVLTGLPSYFFHPRGLSIEQQNRAVALSYYACAPLAIAPCLFPFGWIVHIAFGQRAGFWAAQGLLVLPFIPWWRALLVLTRSGLKLPRPGRTAAVAVAIPVLWIVVGNAAETAAIQAVELVFHVFFSVGE